MGNTRNKLAVTFYLDHEDYLFIRDLAVLTRRTMTSFYREGVSAVIDHYREEMEESNGKAKNTPDKRFR